MRYKKALVTGASSGIGLSICKYLSREGVETIALARNKSRLKTALRGVSKNTKVIVDVSDTDKFLQELSRLDSDIDLLICNVGAGVNMSLKNQQSKEIEKVISTNLTSTILLTQHLLANKRKESELQIVLVSSLAGKMGFPGLSVYSATKFGIEGFAEALRYELEEKEKVKICVLRPGVTDTNFFKRAGMQEFHDSVRGSKTLHSPDAVAEELFNGLKKGKKIITVGNDKYFTPLLPFLPLSKRFKILDITNKL